MTTLAGRRYASQSSNQTVILAGQIGKGGEGVVHDIVGAPDRVAKIYLKRPEPAKIEKISAMSGLATPELLRVCAWPTDILIEGGRPAGFLMPKIGSRADAHELYSPKSRSQHFPDVDFRFLVHVAANVARAFATIHAAGHVIGDVNHGHMLVGADGRVVLIDADSFQVNAGGKLHTCDVGVPLFTPPELQGQTLRGRQRSPNHDLFGLSVMLFHVLMMGRHPYAGVWSGSGDMPIERAIREGRFAYGTRAAQMGMKAPPHTVALRDLGATVGILFEQAFAHPPNATRPQAKAWIGALDLLRSSLVRCAVNPAHWAPKQATDCPWCKLEKTSGVRLFGQRIAASAAAVHVDVSKLWNAITLVPAPPPEPPLPSQVTWSPPVGQELPSPWPKLLRRGASVAALTIGVGGCAVGAGDASTWLGLGGAVAAWFLWPRPEVALVSAADGAVRAAEGRWKQLEDRWKREATTAVFTSLRQKLATAKTQLEGLPAERFRRLARLDHERQAHQRKRYLDRFRIDRASISGIGRGRAATLASFGIETADDVNERSLALIPGFGPVLISTLLAWKRRHEANFRFNPNEPVDPREIARVENDIAASRQQLTIELRTGALQLQRTSRDITAARTRLQPLLKSAWDELKVAKLKREAL